MTNLNFKVDKNKCIRCGLCTNDCISRIISKDEECYPFIKPDNEKNCIKCQHCLAICPVGAISILGKNPDNSVPMRDFANHEDLSYLIQARRSCRHFKRENLPQETLNKLKNILNWTPTGINFRGLHFSVVEDIEVMDDIKKDVNKKFKKLIKFLPPVGILKKLKHMGAQKDAIFRGAPHMIVISVDKKAPCAEVDPIIALSYFDLYAQSLGVGTLWCGFAYMAMKIFPSIAKRMNIPKNHKISYVMMFGAPSLKYARTTQPDDISFFTVK